MLVLEKWFYIIAATMFTVAFFLPNHYFPWSAFYNEFSAALALFFVACGVLFRRRGIVVPCSALVVALVAFIPMLQHFFGLVFFVGDAFVATSYLLGLSAAIVVGFSLREFHGECFYAAIASTLLVIGCLSAFLVFYQWLNLHYLGIWVIDVPMGGRPYGNLAQPNNLSTLLCLSLLSLLYLYEKRSLTAVSSTLILIFLLLAIVLIQSRTAWLIAGVFVVWWLWKRHELKFKLATKVIFGSIILYGLLSQYLPVLADALYLSSDIRNVSAELGVRKVLWIQLLDAVFREPLFGYGWGQVSIAQVAVAADHPLSTYAEYSHNLLLDLLLWNGVLVGFGLIALAVWWFIKKAFACDNLGQWYVLACIFTVVVHSMLEMPHAYTYFLFLIGIFVGAAGFGSQNFLLKLEYPKWINILPLLTGFILLVVFFSDYKKIEENGRRMRFELFGIGDPRATMDSGDILVLTQLQEYIRYAKTQATDHMTDDDLTLMKKVAHRYAYPPALFRYSLALALNGRSEESRRELLTLKQLHGDEMYKEAEENLRLLEQKYPELKNQRLFRERYLHFNNH